MLLPAAAGSLGWMADSSPEGGGEGGIRGSAGERAVIDRLDKLRTVLPALAEDAAKARREAARLRAENAKLLRHLHELEVEYGRLLQTMRGEEPEQRLDL